MNACALANDITVLSKLGLRILLVDDDLDLLDSIYDLLELDNDSVVIQKASDFDSAIRMAESFQPDIALLDIKLGNANGIDLVPILKHVRQDTVCIMMTAFRDVQYAVDALRAGADDFLYKPVEPEILLSTVSHYQQTLITLREKQLSDKRFKAIFEHSYDHLFVLNPHGEIIDVNETALSFYGQSKKEIIGSYFPKVSWWIDSPRNIATITNTLNGSIKGEMLKDEFQLHHVNGDEFIFEFMFTPILDDNSNTLMVIAEGRDITARIKTEKNIIHINQTLEQRVKQRTQELEIARDQADKANAAKTEFLSQMSHELRTPMNAILGFTQIMETNDDEPLQPMQKECVQQVITASDHLMSLINQVLNLARIEADRFEVYLEPVSVSETISKALSLTRPLCDERMLSVDNAIPANDSAYVTADQQAFLQIIINLLSNAIKYNYPQGSIKLYTSPAEDGYLRINIQDTGIGIPEDKYEAVFAPFERITNSQSVDGTGIGLNVSQRMIEMMRGRIGFDSVEEEGSCFWIELKLTAPAVAS